MRAAAQKHLPQWPNEPDPSYQARLHSATLFPAFSRTVEVLAAKPFSKPTTISEDTPARIAEWCEDADLRGRDLQTFLAAQCEAALAYGMAGILVDYPTTHGVKTAADERAAGLRPYLVEIPAPSILGWRSERINGADILTQLRFLEAVTEEEGEFGEIAIEQVRVLYPGRWEVWRISKSAPPDNPWVLFDDGVTSLQKIPFQAIYGRRVSFMQCRPPLIELAHLNVEHWQSKSDQQTILHVARVPILFAKGMPGTAITVGASSAISADDADADLKFVEHTGSAIGAGRQSLLDLEDQMRQVGAELLVIKPGNTSVAQTKADNEPGTCALQRIIQDAEHVADNLIGLMAEWVGETPAGHVTIFQDFGAINMGEATADLLVRMGSSAAITQETMLTELKRRSVLSDDLNVGAEVKATAAARAAIKPAVNDVL